MKLSEFTLLILLLVGLALPLAIFGRPADAPKSSTSARAPVAFRNSTAIQPIPLDHGQPRSLVDLGRRLFHDPGLSRDGSIACVTCHSIYGADAQEKSVGIDGHVARTNAPTVFNSSFNFRQFWDGRAHDLESQVDGPLESPDEMGNRWENVIETLEADESYVAEFGEIFPDGITPKNVRSAIATYERALTTPNSPFDRFLRGDRGALDAVALAGYQRFQEYGCITCHQGVGIGGNLFQKLGVIEDFFETRAQESDSDQGRFRQTLNELDLNVFKVPSLRNVAETAPYFHDGSIATLDEAVRTMARHQLGRSLDDEQVTSIVRFLETLTGPEPEAL